MQHLLLSHRFDLAVLILATMAVFGRSRVMEEIEFEIALMESRETARAEEEARRRSQADAGAVTSSTSPLTPEDIQFFEGGARDKVPPTLSGQVAGGEVSFTSF